MAPAAQLGLVGGHKEMLKVNVLRTVVPWTRSNSAIANPHPKGPVPDPVLLAMKLNGGTLNVVDAASENGALVPAAPRTVTGPSNGACSIHPCTTSPVTGPPPRVKLV